LTGILHTSPPILLDRYHIFGRDLPRNHEGSGVIIEDEVGENVGQGDVLYLRQADGKWWRADADSSSSMPGAGIAMQPRAAGLSCRILKIGFFRDDSWSYTTGGILYVSTAPGPPTQTAPTGSGDQVQVLGFAVGPTVIWFSPCYELVELT